MDDRKAADRIAGGKCMPGKSASEAVLMELRNRLRNFTGSFLRVAPIDSPDAFETSLTRIKRTILYRTGFRITSGAPQ
jgi:ribulose bisphosphate carboxylase small subunit